MEKNVPKVNLSSHIVDGADSSFNNTAVVAGINNLGNYGPLQSFIAEDNSIDGEPKDMNIKRSLTNENEGKAKKTIKLNQIEQASPGQKMSPSPGLR